MNLDFRKKKLLIFQLTELKRLRFQRLADASVDGYVTAKETFDLDDEENEDEDRNNQVDGQAAADRARDGQIRARLTETGIEEEKTSLEEEEKVTSSDLYKTFLTRVKSKESFFFNS